MTLKDKGTRKLRGAQAVPCLSYRVIYIERDKAPADQGGLIVAGQLHAAVADVDHLIDICSYRQRDREKKRPLEHEADRISP